MSVYKKLSHAKAAGAAAPGACDPDGSADGGKNPLLIGEESRSSSRSKKRMAALSPVFFNCSDFEPESIVLNRNSTPVILPGVKLIKGQKVGVDWISCVFNQADGWTHYLSFDDFACDESSEPTEPRDVALFVKQIFCRLLGLYETDESKFREYANGLNCYRYAISLPLNSGIVHAGHASKTVLVTISGNGAFLAKIGWEQRLHAFLTGARGVPALVVWTRFCNSGGLSHGISLTGFVG